MATGGAAAGTVVAAVNCVAHGALVGAVTQGAIGAVSGAVTGAVSHRIRTGSWEGAGEAAIDGAADGFMQGTITGAVEGGLHSNYCFVAGTLVLTQDGEKPIEEIQPGDMVWAWDEETGEVALKPVVETYINQTYELVHVFVNGEEIVATPSHPFYSPVKGWTDAVRLRAGDILVLVNGEYVVVEKVQHEILESPVAVYNFQVADFHTYYVSGTGVLVHNTCTNPGGRHGGSSHRNKVEELREFYRDAGFDVSLKESRVSIPGTNRYRYPDLTITKDGITTYVQVGKATTAGNPIAREIRAISDLLQTGNNVLFFSYN